MDVMTPAFSAAKADEFTTPNRARYLTKEINIFVETRYIEAWSDLAAKLSDNNEPTKTQMLQAPFWALVLMAWKKFLKAPADAPSEKELRNDVGEALREVNQTELDRAIQCAIEHKVLQPLENDPSRLSFNNAFQNDLREYNMKLSKFREEFSPFILSKIQTIAP
jgi:hypothetical protein